MTTDPIGPTGTEPDRCRCGSEIRPTGRCARGHVQAGNGLATNVGHRSVAFWRDHEAQQRALVAAIVSDAGHSPADAPRALLEAAEGLAQAMLVTAECNAAVKGGAEDRGYALEQAVFGMAAARTVVSG